MDRQWVLPLALANRAAFHTVETEVLKSDEGRLVETPKIDVPNHLFLFFSRAF